MPKEQPFEIRAGNFIKPHVKNHFKFRVSNGKFEKDLETSISFFKKHKNLHGKGKRIRQRVKTYFFQFSGNIFVCNPIS